MATQEELDALTLEQREAAVARLWSALDRIGEALSDLSDEELAALEQDLVDDVNDGLRRRADALRRAAS